MCQDQITILVPMIIENKWLKCRGASDLEITENI